VRATLLVALVLAATLVAPSAARAIPSIDVRCNQSPTCDGVWFTSPVFVDWTVAGETSRQGCNDVTIDQDTTGNPQGCIATGGGTVNATVVIRVDRTPPSITAAIAERPPDHGGWYTHPVTFAPQATDATSGLLGCEPAPYAGPDSIDARVVATCRDTAGNAASRAFPLRYDATPPDTSAATATTGDGVVRLSWPAGATARVMRTPGPGKALYDGPGGGFTDRGVRNGRRYHYILTLTDEAGNDASRDLSATPRPHLINPAPGARVATAPVLRWTPVRGARYYNVQLFRGRHKLLSAWPARTRLALRPTWRFGGKRRQLAGAPLRWYVWPGRGPRVERRYGPLIGRRSFTLAPPPAGQTAGAAPRR
jgi:hypothetical protein